MDRFETFVASINTIYRLIQKIKDSEMREFGLRGAHVMCLYMPAPPSGGTYPDAAQRPVRRGQGRHLSWGIGVTERGYLRLDLPEGGSRYRALIFYHFAIADANGKAVVVEYIDDELSIVDSPYATNFLLTPGDYDFGTGQDRYATLEVAYAEHEGTMDAALVMDTLASVKQVSYKNHDGKTGATQWSCVYNPQELTVTICYDMDYDSPRVYSLVQ